MLVFGVFLVRIFQHSDWLRIQSECLKMQTEISEYGQISRSESGGFSSPTFRHTSDDL